MPTLQAALPSARLQRGRVLFDINKPAHPIACCETGNQAILVFKNPAREIVGHADVQDAVTSIGQDIDVAGDASSTAVFVTVPGLRRITACCAAPGTGVLLPYADPSAPPTPWRLKSWRRQRARRSAAILCALRKRGWSRPLTRCTGGAEGSMLASTALRIAVMPRKRPWPSSAAAPENPAIGTGCRNSMALPSTSRALISVSLRAAVLLLRIGNADQRHVAGLGSVLRQRQRRELAAAR